MTKKNMIRDIILKAIIK